MTNEEFEAKLLELHDTIQSLPEPQRARLFDLLKETRQRYVRTVQALTEARNAVDDWRLLAKYQVFNSEATLREANAPRNDQPNDPQDPI